MAYKFSSNASWLKKDKNEKKKNDAKTNGSTPTKSASGSKSSGTKTSSTKTSGNNSQKTSWSTEEQRKRNQERVITRPEYTPNPYGDAVDAVNADLGWLGAKTDSQAKYVQDNIYKRNAGRIFMNSGMQHLYDATLDKITGMQGTVNQNAARFTPEGLANVNNYLGQTYDANSTQGRLVRARTGDLSVLDEIDKEVASLDQTSSNDRKKIEALANERKQLVQTLNLSGFEAINSALNEENGYLSGVSKRQAKYSRENMLADLNLINEYAKLGATSTPEYTEAAVRFRNYFGDDPTAIAAREPGAGWTQKYIDRYDRDENAFNEYVKSVSGLTGTEAEIDADRYLQYVNSRLAKDNSEDRENEWADEKNAIIAEAKSQPGFEAGSAYREDTPWYVNADGYAYGANGYGNKVEGNGQEVVNAAAAVRDLVYYSDNDAEFEKVLASVANAPDAVRDIAGHYAEIIKHMDADERAKWIYDYNVYGPEAAMELFDEEKNPAFNRDMYKKYYTEKKTRIEGNIEKNPWMAVPYNVASVGSGMLNAFAGAANLANMASGGSPGHEYSRRFEHARIDDTISEKTTEEILKAAPNANIGRTNIPNFLYGVASSMGDSMANRAVFGQASSIAMGMSAFNSAWYKNIEEKGDVPQAAQDAFMRGLITTATEHIGTDQWFKNKGLANPGEILWKQSAAEGVEEGLDKIGNWTYDQLAYGDEDPTSLAISDLIAKGYSPAEARRQVYTQNAWELGESVLAGNLSGFGSSVVPAGQSAIANYQAGSNLRKYGDNETLDALIGVAETVPLNKNEKKLLERLKAEIAADGAQEADTEEDVPEETADQEATEQQEAPKPEINPAERLNDMKPQEREKKEAPPLPVFNRHKETTDTRTGGKETETAPEVIAPEETAGQEAPEAVEEQAEDIAEEVKENPKANAAKAADKMNKAAKAKGAKKVTKAQLGMLYRSVAAKLDERAQDALRERMSFNVAKELEQKGVKGTQAKELATSILRIQDGNFTQEDFEAVQNDSVARSVLADWTQKLDAENKAQAQMAQIRSIMPRGPMTMTGGAKDGEKDAIEANDEFAVKAAEVEEKAKGRLISDDENSTIDGEAVKIVGAAPPTTADGGDVAMVKVQAEDGTQRIVAADSIAYSEADSTAYDLAQYATSYGANADIMYGAYQAGQDVGAYAAAFDIAARHGSDGRNINTILGGSVANVLTENQIKTAYELGRGMRAQRSQKAHAARSKKGAGAKVGNVDTSAIADAQLNKHQKATVKAMESVAELLGINVRFVESKADAKGRFTTENGSWDANTRTLTVDIHAGSNLKNDVHYSMMDTVGHELTHYIKQLADSKMWDDYQNFVMSHLGEKMNLGKEIEKKLAQNEGLSRDDAIEEIIADASAQALSRITDQQIAEMAQSNPNLLKKIAAFIKKWVSDFRKQIRKAFSTQEAAANRFAKAMEDSLDEMAAKWNAMLVNAQKNAQGTKADTTVEAAMAEATEGAVNEDGEKLFSLRTMREDKDYYRELLIEYGSMNHADIRALFNTIDKLMAEIEANRTILDFGEDIDSDKRSFKPVKPNSDPLYQVSVDFSTLCRKRLLQQVCQERLEAAMGRAVTKAERVAIRDELIKLQKQGKQIEVACALCYVESARLKSPAQIQRFMENREKVIRDYFARRNPETKVKMEKAEADYRKANNIGNESLKNLPSAIATKVRNAKNAPIAEYKVSAQEQKTIDKALGMTVSEFTTADSLWNLKSSDPVLFDIYTSYIRNATKSKGIESDTPWKAGDSEAISDTLIEKMNQENGLRTQSWSDFQTYHILDYIASVIELSTRNAKMQAYTKVPAYVKLMGKTGIMINMSLIPAAKFDGTLQYDDVEGFVHEMAFDLRKKYPETAGTICIGIDDTQIRMLLENDEIDYVIPYHKSGMDAKTRQKMQIPTWKDYELQQSEKPLNKKAGKAPKFSEWFDYKTAVRDAEYANSTAEGKAAIAAGDVMYGAKIAMQNAAQHYLNLCAERNLAPKFEKFKNEDGYWKLLIDRKMINNETGAIIEQKAVQPRFNEDDLIEICRDEVARFNQNNADFDAAVDAILNAYENGTLGKTAKSKKVQQIVKSHEDWVAVQAAIGTHDQLVPDVKRSAREMDTEYQKAYESGDENRARELVRKAAIAAGYNPLKLYHGTMSFGFTKLDPSKADDGISFFVTPDEMIAETYVGATTPIRRIGSGNAMTVDQFTEADGEKLLSLLNKHFYDQYRAVDEKEKAKLISETGELIRSQTIPKLNVIKETIPRLSEELLLDNKTLKLFDDVIVAIEKISRSKDRKTVQEAYQNYREALDNLDFRDEQIANIVRYKVGKELSTEVYEMERYTSENLFEYEDELGWGTHYTTREEALTMLYPKLFHGIYELYGKTNNLLEINGHGANWNRIDGTMLGKEYAKTRDFAAYAKELGFDGVHFKNIHDSGEMSSYDEAGDVYTFFNPSDIKSADPFTFDDAGNLIPLSERFNKKETDIRYSAREENVNYQMRDANFAQWFGNSVVVNADGTPKVLYHQTNADFTAFDVGREGAGYTDSVMPSGIYMKDFPDTIKLGLNYESSHQMGLYASIQNPLVFNDRDEAKQYWVKHVPGYAKLSRELDELDARYNAEMDRLEALWFHADDAISEKAMDDSDRMLEEWTGKSNAKRRELHAAIDSYIRNNSYDGIILEADQGTGGTLKTYVAFKNTQVKSSTDNVGTYDRNNPDIRYQMRDPSEVSDREMLVSMLDNVNLSVEDRNRLNVYRERIGELNEKQQLLEQTITKIRMLRKADEKGNREEIIKLKNQQEIYAKQLERADAKLLEIEALGPIREMAKRQRAAYVQQTRAKNSEKMQEYRNRKKEEARERIEKIRAKEAIKRNDLHNEIGRLKRVAEPNLKERYRNKILSDVKKLYSWVATPTNKAHVPEFLKAPLGEFIQSIDYSAINVLEDVRKVREKTKREISMAEALENLRRVLANAHNQKNIEEGAVQQYGYMDLPAQYLEQMDELVGDIKEALKNAATVTDTPLMLLNSDQLKYLSEKITVLKHSVEKMNENFNKNQFESPRSSANATIEDMYKLKAKIKTNQMLETLNGMYNWKNATPIYAFQRLGAGGKAVFAGMQDGWDKMAQNSATLIEFAENTFTAKQAKEWSRDIKTIELANGESVKMTVAQIMSVYCLNKREQAVGHLLGGGMRVAEIKLGKGNVLNQAENHTLTEGDIGKMISLLTTEQISVATKLQTFMNTVCSDWGNEISMKRFGYKMFTEQFYFPIEVDPNNLIGGEDKQEKKNSMFRLLNMSAMKPLTPKANNALIVRDIFDVFTAHTTDIAKYNALALPILDMIRWYNYVEKSDVLDKDGKFTGQIRTRSTQRALEHAYGSNAKQYIRRFMEDLNAEHDGGRNDGVLQKLMGNAKAASVGANARVYFLQITSLPRAAYVINPKYLMKGLMKLRSLNPVNAIKGTEAQDKIGIMKWKSLGFYNTDIARSTRGMVRRDEGFLSKLRGWVMKPAEWGDNWVGNIIYEAAKAEMKDKHPGAKPGTKAYDELLNRRVREIVYKTQVVDSTMTRSDFMRSKGIMQLFTAFMSEPTLTVNMLNESVQEAVANRRSGMTGKENWKSVGGKAARALATFAVSACSAALIEALFDAFRDDDEYETFWEKYLDGLFGERMKDADTFGKKFWAFLDGNIAENMNVISMLPLFKDALSKLQGFEENSMVMQVVDQFMDTWKAIDAWQKGERPLYNAIYNMLKVVGSSSGVGVQNATRDGIAIWNTFFADAVGQPKVQTYENTKSDAAAAYYDAIRNDDTEKAEWILERAAIRGYNEEDFIGKIKDYVKADYVQGDIDKKTAEQYLKDYTGKDSNSISEQLEKWDYQKETGRSFDNMREDYIAGIVSKDVALEFYKADTVAKWDYAKQTGHNYDDMRDEYISGSMSESQAKQYLKTYGGKNEEEAAEQIDRWDFFEVTGMSEGYTRYWRMYDAFENGGNFQKYAKEWIASGVKKGDMARSIAGRYKEEYLAIKGTPAGDRMLEHLLDLYVAIGYEREYERNYINKNWTLDE